MQANVSFTRARSAILAAGGLLCLITLSGCAGGGGGGGLSTPSPFVYPPSLEQATSSDTVDGFISPYKLDAAGTTISSVLPTVSGTAPSAGKITITVDAIPLSSTVEEPKFVVTFDSTTTNGSTLPSLLSSNPFSSPLDSLPSLTATGPCQDCLRVVTAPAKVNNVETATVTFIYLDPTSTSFPLRYSVLGLWAKPTTTSAGSPDPFWPEVGGAFSAGVLTRGIDLPTTGSAGYAGYFVGRYATSDATLPYSPGTYIVGANASATADFSARTVMFQTANTYIAPEAGGAAFAEPKLDLMSTPMTILAGSTTNSFTGSVGSKNLATGFFPSTTGKITGGFYGAPDTSTGLPSSPPELGGSLSVGNGVDKELVGGFALVKKTSTP